ncbi:MAG TPA: methyltransferase domain-containing protein [Ktedonobacterales bacterium]|nr:methyltransferase domain-containing protein [Ktedonobacterales bacterium]
MERPQTDDNTTPTTDEQTLAPDELRERLIGILKANDALHDPTVERALRTVPRHLFLPDVSLDQAYADAAIATHWEGAIAVSSASQPAIVAIMLEQLQLTPDMDVLEIGAGTGYNAALMAELVGPLGHVTTVDIDPEIVAEARAHLDAAGYSQVRAIAADGAFGWPEGAPYDRIILTVGAADIAPAWFEQLAEGGILLLPLLLGGAEASAAFRKRAGELVSESLAPCGFMRLRGAEAWPDQWVPLADGRRLFAEHASDLAVPIASLLRTRPRRRLWTHPPTPAVQQYLGLRGYTTFTIFTERKIPQRSRVRGRWGVYVGEPGGGPSLVLFANTLPMLLAFGTPAAERILEAELPGWQSASYQPIERRHVIARPRAIADATPPPAGASRVSRRHFTFDVWTDDELRY